MRPITLIAELTHRCPLRCPYCSNPTELVRGDNELSTDGWLRAIDEAAALGVLQIHFTGGEPLARRDLEVLIERARMRDLYVNVITSAIPFERARFERFAALGVDHVQISLQDVDERGDAIAGFPAHETKLAAARAVVELGMSLSINVVLHRENIDRVEQLIELARSLGADRVELANAQWAGFAFDNRAALLPSIEQIERARAVAAGARGRMEIAFVLADHFSSVPRACMDGWGRRYLHIAPDGAVLPCHSARTIPGLCFERVGDLPLAEIWRGPAFEAFRGEAWMSETCACCERRSIDFGGCRCQAFALTGDARATDPACARSPHHKLIERAHAEAGSRHYLHRGS